MLILHISELGSCVSIAA